MAVNVSYKNRIGYYTKTERYPDEPERKFKNWICHANCLWADMYFYKVSEDYERFGEHYHKGDKMAQLIAFWLNPQHLKRAITEGYCYEGADDFHFFADQMDAQIWKAVKILADAGKKVTIVKSQNKKK